MTNNVKDVEAALNPATYHIWKNTTPRYISTLCGLKSGWGWGIATDRPIRYTDCGICLELYASKKNP